MFKFYNTFIHQTRKHQYINFIKRSHVIILKLIWILANVYIYMKKTIFDFSYINRSTVEDQLNEIFIQILS